MSIRFESDRERTIEEKKEQISIRKNPDETLTLKNREERMEGKVNATVTTVTMRLREGEDAGSLVFPQPPSRHPILAADRLHGRRVG
jgi:hypothetical protein